MKMNSVLFPSGAIGDDAQNIRQPFSTGTSQASRHVVWELPAERAELLLSALGARDPCAFRLLEPVLSEPSAGSRGLQTAPRSAWSELQTPGCRRCRC